MIKTFWFNISEHLRYLLVGGFNTALSLFLFAVFYFILKDSLNYLWISIIVHFISVLNSTITFRYLVFRVYGSFWKYYIKTNISYLLYLALNTGLLYVLCDKLKIHPIFASVINACILTPLFFFVHKFFSFK